MDPAEYLIPGLARLANAQNAGGAPRKEGEATIESLPVDCLGLILDMVSLYRYLPFPLYLFSCSLFM